MGSRISCPVPSTLLSNLAPRTGRRPPCRKRWQLSRALISKPSNSAPASLEINLQEVVPEIVGKWCIICTLARSKQELRLMSSAYDSKLYSWCQHVTPTIYPNAMPISIHITPIHLPSTALWLVFDQP